MPASRRNRKYSIKTPRVGGMKVAIAPTAAVETAMPNFIGGPIKMKSILLAICLLLFPTYAGAQNSIKLFDAIPIAQSDLSSMMNSSPWGMYMSAQVYLNCPTFGKVTSSISGPEGGDLIVDNALLVNGSGICSGNCFSQVFANPNNYIGMPVEMAYIGVSPRNVSGEISGTGLYTFQLLDYGYNYGNNAVYLNTSCSIVPVNTPPADEPVPGGSVVCHRNNGNVGSLTLNVGPAAIAAHLAHGDTLGACGQ
jgi:hypothetical protein